MSLYILIKNICAILPIFTTCAKKHHVSHMHLNRNCVPANICIYACKNLIYLTTADNILCAFKKLCLTRLCITYSLWVEDQEREHSTLDCGVCTAVTIALPEFCLGGACWHTASWCHSVIKREGKRKLLLPSSFSIELS